MKLFGNRLHNTHRRGALSPTAIILICAGAALLLTLTVGLLLNVWLDDETYARLTAGEQPPEEQKQTNKSYTRDVHADAYVFGTEGESVWAKAGKNLVVEGPPGTGKSQTIANMIAEMLSAGKTVLFVSEKMAALEVVKRRLDSAGLSRFCLELHSQTAKKVEFIRELERCIQHPSSPAADSRDNTQMEALKTELSGYCSELREPIGACGFSPYDLFGIREQYAPSSITSLNGLNESVAAS